ncbi:MAG: undecaprenyl/decaprenyl-phosphate alpha-N-acetylglucosaminyl 1-phosphate transferase [Treponema sp.]|nr:undecaprenyl/decaprenyl-phosphate alpha-N-acetylglucosaminyl 1-phosphate transferase [Treponema sp.]
MVYSLLIAFGVSALLMPLIIYLCNKFSIYDYADERKIHTGNVPRLGSIGFVTAFILATLFYTLFTDCVSLKEILPVLVSGVLIFAFGIFDDFKNLRGIFKLAVQVIVALIMVFNGYSFRNIMGIELKWAGYVISFAWIIGVINAFNLIDGFDGLCGGLSFIAALAMAFITKKSSSFTFVLFLNLAACLLGFWIFNKPKAKIFMGDGGSQFIGFIFASIPLAQMESPFEETKLFGMIIICSIPLFDVIAAMWRRIRERRSFFSPDKAHLHHKLMNLGYKPWGILGLLYFIQLLLCGSVVLAVYMDKMVAMIIYGLSFLFVLAFFSVIHYANRAVLNAKGEYVSWQESHHKDEVENNNDTKKNK